MSDRVYFVEPRNDFTNEYLARELPEENAIRDFSVIGSNQKRRRVDAWCCQEVFVRRFLQATGRALIYRIYVRYGGGLAHEVSRLAFRRAPVRKLVARAKAMRRAKDNSTPF